MTKSKNPCNLWNLWLKKHSFEQLHRHAHNVCQGAIDVVNEWVVVTDGIGAGFILPDAAFDMRGNLGIGQLSGVNNRNFSFDDFKIARFTDKGEASDNLVGFAEEHSRNLFGVFGVTGFADDLAFEIDNGISAYNNRIRVFIGDVVCFGEGKLFGVFDRSDIFSRENGFIYL